MGGILPTIARDWHEENIEYVVTKALEDAGLTAHDVDAIAVTMKPGTYSTEFKVSNDSTSKLIDNVLLRSSHVTRSWNGVWEALVQRIQKAIHTHSSYGSSRFDSQAPE